MIRSHTNRRHRPGHRLTVVFLTVALAATILTWSWNTVAVDVLALPAIDFRHALALGAALAVLTLLPITVARSLRRPDGEDGRHER